MQNRKLENLKKILFKIKKVHKASSSSKRRLDRKKLIVRQRQMNNINSQKYGYPAKAVEENAVKSEKFREIYDFYRLFKVKEHAKQYARTDTKKDKT